MARQKEFDPDERLDLAVAAFWRTGYAGTSTQELVDAMRLGKRSLYDTYGNKADLYRRAVTRYIQRAEADQQALLDAASSPREALRKIFDSVVRVPAPTPPGCFAVACASDAGAGDREVTAMATRYFERTIDTFRVLIAQAASRDLSDEEALSRATIMHDAWVGIRVRLAAGLPRDAVDRAVDDLVAVALS